MNKAFALPTTDITCSSQRPICIVSHPRSGTHLTIDFIRRHFPQTTKWKYPMQDSRVLILDTGQIWKKETTFEKAFQRLRDIQYPIVKMHGFDYELLKAEHIEWIDWLNEEAHILYIVRNIKNMICSYHEYVKSFWEPAKVPMKEFIRQYEAHASSPFTSRIKYWSDEIVRWSQKPGVHIIKYEDIFEHPLEQVHKFSDILEIPPKIKHPLLPPKIHNRWEDYIKRYLTILPETTSVVIKTRSPKWYEVLDQEDLEFIRSEAKEALDILNYEI